MKRWRVQVLAMILIEAFGDSARSCRWREQINAIAGHEGA
jgi:hypothetical protein